MTDPSNGSMSGTGQCDSNCLIQLTRSPRNGQHKTETTATSARDRDSLRNIQKVSQLIRDVEQQGGSVWSQT